MKTKSTKRMMQPSALASEYLYAKEWLIQQGYSSEIDWQYEVNFLDTDSKSFVREASWVVLCSGFKESIVRAKFEAIGEAYNWWEDTEWCVRNIESCGRNALSVFANKRKISAISEITLYVAQNGVEELLASVCAAGPIALTKLPMIGPTTACHLAKNLGHQVAKPDIHLNSITKMYGYQSAEELCRVVSNIVGDPVSVVDVVFWRCFEQLGRSLRSKLLKWVHVKDKRTRANPLEMILMEIG